MRHRERLYGFVDAPSLRAFVASPDAYVGAVLATVKAAPELIHILRLEAAFPAASIGEIMRKHAQAPRQPEMSQNRAEMRSINSGFGAMALPRCSENRDLAEL